MSYSKLHGHWSLWRSLWNWLSLLLIVAGCFVGIVPLLPWVPGDDLDSSWMLAMNAAVERGLVFGRDVVFTFGPYASAYTGAYHPATDRLMLASTGLIAFAIAAGVAALSAGRHRVAALLLVLLLPAITWLRDPYFLRDAPFMIAPLLFLAVVCRVAPAGRHVAAGAIAALLLLAAALGLLPLVKGTFAVAAGVGMGLGVLMLLLCRRAILALGLALACLISMPLSWSLSGQALADLPGFFVAQGPTIQGYTEAMSVYGPRLPLVLYAAGCLVLLLLHLPGLRADPISLGALLLGTAALLFIGFKAGFVRQDEHVLIASGTLVLSAWVLMLERRNTCSLLGLLAALGAWVAIDRTTLPSAPSVPARLQAAFQHAADGLRDRLRDDDTLQRRYEQSRAEMRAHHPLPQLDGTTDIYTVGQALLLAHDVPWSPRPVPQSYSAYTPSLAQLNATHLMGPKAPNNVLFTLEAIDGRLASLEDGLSWPILLTHYRVFGSQDGRALLRRRPDASAASIEGVPFGVARHAVGRTVELPTSPTGLWARIELWPTLLGRLAAFVYKPPTVSIHLTLVNGRVETRRYLPTLGAAGFLLSPLVDDTAQFVALAAPAAADGGDAAGRMAVSLRIDGARGTRLLWQDSYALELHALRMPP